MSRFQMWAKSFPSQCITGPAGLPWTKIPNEVGAARLLNTLRATLMDESECPRQPASLYGLQVNERLLGKTFRDMPVHSSGSKFEFLVKQAGACGILQVLVNTEEKETGTFWINFIKTHTSACAVLKEQNPVAIGEEWYTDDCVPQKSSRRDNSCPPCLTRKDTIIDLRTHELRLQLSCASKGVTFILVSWHSSASCAEMFNTWQHYIPHVRILGVWLESPSPEALGSREAVTHRPWARKKPAAFRAVDIQWIEQQYLVLWIFKAFWAHLSPFDSP